MVGKAGLIRIIAAPLLPVDLYNIIFHALSSLGSSLDIVLIQMEGKEALEECSQYIPTAVKP